ncbi:MAG TPA: sigma-70 family RNA polymerase sigma factor [Puia sp.]|jgi:RNA polymerase sigma factor (sigma-70 family)|nr:sigma-70 family RNA polymerase sigma factor [Puia sp.]
MSVVNLLGEDLLLWNEYRSGNAGAFGALIRVHYPDLFHYGTRFTRDSDLVKDCLQDLFLELWINRETISETSFVKYYLLKALRRKLTRRIGRSRYTGSWEELHFESIFNGTPSVEAGLIREEGLAELARKMRQALAGLSKRQQEAIYLRYYFDAEIDEIAEIMSVNRQSVYNHLHDALKKLKKSSGKPSRFFLFLPLL